MAFLFRDLLDCWYSSVLPSAMSRHLFQQSCMPTKTLTITYFEPSVTTELYFPFLGARGPAEGLCSS